MARKEKLADETEEVRAIQIDALAEMYVAHCLHETGVMSMTRPIVYVHKCCWCGSERTTRGTMRRPIEGHGTALSSSYSEEVYESPWTDECTTHREAIRVEIERRYDESDHSDTGSTGNVEE